MNWLEVAVLTDGEAAEAVSDALRPYAYQKSVVLEQLGDQTNLAPDALEPYVTVKIYLKEDDNTAQTRHKIEETLFFLSRLYHPIPEPKFKLLAAQDWENAWKKYYEPFRIGRRIWIQPSWQQVEKSDDGVILLTLDPGMAFGTGLHPTTQMCVQALEQIIEPGVRVLDVGTGSGILAIAAALLGAGFVYGVDNDEVAIESAQENSERNHVTKRVQLELGSLSRVEDREWNVVVVNILAPAIIEMLQENELASFVLPGGYLILSGIIDEQMPAVEAALIKQGVHIKHQLQIRDWVTLIAMTH